MMTLKNKMREYPTISSAKDDEEIIVPENRTYKKPPLIAGTMNNWNY
jgi:hypothetical protein